MIGLKAGPVFIDAIREVGLAVFFGGIVVTLVPQFVGLLVGRYLLRIEPLLLGALAGAQTMTAALAAVQDRSDSPVTVIGYSSTVAFSHIQISIGASSASLANASLDERGTGEDDGFEGHLAPCCRVGHPIRGPRHCACSASARRLRPRGRGEALAGVFESTIRGFVFPREVVIAIVEFKRIPGEYRMVSDDGLYQLVLLSTGPEGGRKFRLDGAGRRLDVDAIFVLDPVYVWEVDRIIETAGNDITAPADHPSRRSDHALFDLVTRALTDFGYFYGHNAGQVAVSFKTDRIFRDP
jgi:hypothetical protein